MKEAEIVKQEGESLISKLGFQATVEVEEREEGFYVHIKTDEDASLLIGKHAQSLRSLQRIFSIILYKKLDKKIRLLLDINDYRARQRERLENIAENIANRVLQEEREARLRSFSSYERKIIHEYISSHHKTLTSYSEGEEPHREMVIAMKGEEGRAKGEED